MVTYETAKLLAVVRKAMKRQGVSELKLSDKSFIPRTTLRRKLQGSVDFSIGELITISLILGIGNEVSAFLDAALANKAAA